MTPTSRPLRKHSQIVFEFIMYWTIAIIVVLILMGVGINLSLDAMDTHADEEAEDLARSIQDELILAAQTSEGYHREILLPAKIKNSDYSLSTTNGSFTLTRNGGTVITLRTPFLNGTLQHGNNVIINENNIITITH